MQRDLVLRWIEQLGRLVARLLGRSDAKAELALAQEQVAEATDGLLGPLARLVPRLEVDSAAELLADPDRIFGYAQLLDLDGAIAEALGGTGSAETRARALAFARKALERTREPRGDWEEWIQNREQEAGRREQE